MNGIGAVSAAFKTAKQEGRAALVPYFTLGFPEQGSSLEIVQAISRAGADLIELGVPFSDPLADGPTIQHSTQIALEKGTTTRRCLEMVAELRGRGVAQPLFLMGYYNPILAFGVEAYAASAAAAGTSGLIVPDLPVEEAGEIEAACRSNGLALVYLLAPTSTTERIEKAAGHTTGFLYLVSLTGVTGARQSLDPNLEAFVGRVRAQARTPIAVGFGISTEEQAHCVGSLADGVIIGSALVSAVANSADPCATASDFVARMKKAVISGVG